MRKNARLNFRVSEHEKYLIQSKADKAKTNLSKYLLACVLDKKIVVVDGLRETLAELRRIGNNLNQLTVLMRTGRVENANLAPLKEDFDKVVTAIERMKEAG